LLFVFILLKFALFDKHLSRSERGMKGRSEDKPAGVLAVVLEEGITG